MKMRVVKKGVKEGKRCWMGLSALAQDRIPQPRHWWYIEPGSSLWSGDSYIVECLAAFLVSTH